jgi:hypothetical protein
MGESDMAKWCVFFFKTGKLNVIGKIPYKWALNAPLPHTLAIGCYYSTFPIFQHVHESCYEFWIDTYALECNFHVQLFDGVNSSAFVLQLHMFLTLCVVQLLQEDSQW